MPKSIPRRHAARRRTAKASEADAQFRNLLDAAPDAIVVVNEMGKIVFVNSQTERLFGYQREEMLGRDVEVIVPVRLREQHRHDRMNFFADPHIRPTPVKLQLFALRKDGTEVPVEISLSPVETPEGFLVTSAIRDVTERKAAEESRLRLAKIVESSEDAIISKTLDGLISSWNAGAQRMFGYTEEEALGQPITILFPPELQNEENKILAKLRAGERIEHYETIRVTKAGKRVNVSLTISPIRDTSGRVAGFSKIARDITQRKWAEEALRASAERLRLAQRGARLGTFERDVRTGRITWSEGLESLYGLPPGSLDGKTTAFFKELIHPTDYEQAVRLIDDALKTGQPTEGEWRAVWPDGTVHWIAARWQVLMDANGEASRVVGVNMDITERKLAEEALLEMNRTLEAQGSLLRSREEFLGVFIKNVPAAVAMLDRDMRYLQVSDRWCTDYLPGIAQVLGRSHYEIFPDMPERWKEVHRRALQGETQRADEDRWDGQDGPHWARWEVRPWKTPEGVVGGILILAEDITRRKQMEETLSDMSRKLIESQEQERARIARELHDDINQRLAILAMEIAQLQGSPSEVETRVKELQNQIGEISHDVEGLAHDLHSSKLDYLGIVAGIKGWCLEFAERQKVEIDFKSDVLSVLPHEVGLSLLRVLQEALHNAIKYSGVRSIHVELREQSGEIHLIVSDLGRGFDLEAALKGKGLGLTSMRERVRLVNGNISIESKPMGGTTIHVRVPRESQHSSQRAAG